MATLKHITPFLRVPDIEAAVSFFVDTLGFKVSIRAGYYAFVWRDGAAFRLMEDERLTPRGGGRYTSYIDVDDADALYAELEPKLNLLPAGHVNPPCDMDYGQRDFSVMGPDGDLIGFGSPLPEVRA